MPALYGGGVKDDSESAPWRWEVQLVDKNLFVNREEKADPRGDAVMECDCRYLPGREKGDIICTGERCLNFATYTECVPGKCSKSCGNQRIRKGIWACTEVRPSGGKGWGLYLTEDVKAGSLIAEYVGEVINARELDMRKKQRRRDRHLFFLWLNNNEAIDATEKGGKARFINHCCEPNCVAEKWKVGNEWRIGFFAMRDMEKETELSIEYGWDQVHGRKKTKCLCGAPTCRGWIEKDDAGVVQLEETWSQIRGVVGTWRVNRREEGEYGEGLMSKKVRVFRPALMRYIEGTVEGYDADTGLHQVYYADGSEEKFNLATEKWQIWAEAENFVIKKTETEEDGGAAQPPIPTPYLPPPSNSLGGGGAAAPLPVVEDGPIETLEVQVPFDAVGMIIGRAGSTIRSIIQETGVQDFEFQKVVDKKSIQMATIKGTPAAVAACDRRIKHIMKTVWAARASRAELINKEEDLKKKKEEEEAKLKKELPKRRSKEELLQEISSFDGRWCHGFQWFFTRGLIDEIFGSTASYGGRQSRGASITSPVLNRALDLIHDAGHRFPQVADPALACLHASVLFLRYVALKPKEHQTLSLVDTAPACLFLAIKLYCQVGGRALKDFFEISYACRYPGQQNPLVTTSNDGEKGGGGRVLTVEGRNWQEKVLDWEQKILHAMGLDLYLSDPFELCRARFLSGLPQELQLEAVTKAAEDVLTKSAYTTVWLQHDPSIVSAAAALVGQIMVHQVTNAFGDASRAPALWMNDVSRKLVIEGQHGSEISEAAKALLCLEVSSPDYVASLAQRVGTLIEAVLLLATKKEDSPPRPNSLMVTTENGGGGSSASLNSSSSAAAAAAAATAAEQLQLQLYLGAQTVPYLPSLHDSIFVEEKTAHKIKKTAHKIKTKYVRTKEEGSSVVAALVWNRYLQGKLMLSRWPNEKSSQYEARLERSSGFSAGFSPSALRELFLLQRLHHDAIRRKGCPYVITPLSLITGNPEANALAASASTSTINSNNNQPTPPSSHNKNGKDNGSSISNSNGSSPLLSILDIMDHRGGGEKGSSLLGGSSSSLGGGAATEQAKEAATNASLSQASRYTYLGLERVQYTLAGMLRYTARGGGGDHPTLGPPLQRSMIRNIFQGFKWCHERGIVLKAIDPNQIYLDRSGTVKLGCFDEAILLPSKGAETIRHTDKTDRASGAKQLDEIWEESKKRKKIIQAPEMMLGAEASRASDMWAVGCLLAMILLGRPPFDANNAKKLMEHIYRVVGSYDHSWKAGKSLPLYDLCRPQKHSGYACRIVKHVQEMVHSARNKRHLEVPDAGVALLPIILHLDPLMRATAAQCLYAPYFQHTIPHEMQARQEAWMKVTSKVVPLMSTATPKPYALPDDTSNQFDLVRSYPPVNPCLLGDLFSSSALAPPPPPTTAPPSSFSSSSSQPPQQQKQQQPPPPSSTSSTTKPPGTSTTITSGHTIHIRSSNGPSSTSTSPSTITTAAAKGSTGQNSSGAGSATQRPLSTNDVDMEISDDEGDGKGKNGGGTNGWRSSSSKAQSAGGEQAKTSSSNSIKGGWVTLPNDVAHSGSRNATITAAAAAQKSSGSSSSSSSMQKNASTSSNERSATPTKIRDSVGERSGKQLQLQQQQKPSSSFSSSFSSQAQQQQQQRGNGDGRDRDYNGPSSSSSAPRKIDDGGNGRESSTSSSYRKNEDRGRERESSGAGVRPPSRSSYGSAGNSLGGGRRSRSRERGGVEGDRGFKRRRSRSREKEEAGGRRR